MQINYEEKFQEVWKDLTTEQQVRPVNNPKGFVLGGQPGAGKSAMVERLVNELDYNLLVINGDEFRRYHPDFDAIQAKYGKDAPKYTAEFSGKITGMAIQKALAEKYNVSVEGTFRTAETPMNTLDDMKRHGYETAVYIQTAPKDVSWASTIERYNAMEKLGEQPRATPKEHHDLVVSLLPQNADTVFKSGKADNFRVYARDDIMLFDDKLHAGQQPGSFIEKELHRNERLLAELQQRHADNHHLLTPMQKTVFQEAKKIIGQLPPEHQIQAKLNLYSTQIEQIEQTRQMDSGPEIER